MVLTFICMFLWACVCSQHVHILCVQKSVGKHKTRQKKFTFTPILLPNKPSSSLGYLISMVCSDKYIKLEKLTVL